MTLRDAWQGAYFYIRRLLQQKLYNDFSPEGTNIIAAGVHIIKTLTLII